MRKVFFYLFIMLFIYACGATTPREGTSVKYKIISCIFDLNTNDIRRTVAEITIKDTFMLVEEIKDNGDTVHSKKQVRDTFFRVPVAIPMTDSVTKKPILDSTGKQKYEPIWIAMPKRFYIRPTEEKDVTGYFPKK